MATFLVTSMQIRGTQMPDGVGSQDRPGSHIRRLWNGELSLLRSFWVYLILGNTVGQLMVVWLLALTLFRAPSASEQLTPVEGRGLLIALSIVVLAYMVYSVFTGIAVIRCSSAYVKSNTTSLPKRVLGRIAQFFGGLVGFAPPLLLMLVFFTLFQNPGTRGAASLSTPRWQQNS
jgi:hypothetical protein